MADGNKLTFLLLFGVLCRVQANRCTDRTIPGVTTGKVVGDNGFSLHITGDPEVFLPRASYTVRLRGDKDSSGQKQFQRFVLSANNDNQHRPAESGSAGTFQLFGDIHTQYSDHCANTIVETSSVTKDEIQVLWVAPPAGHGCVQFRATVLEEGYTWAMDDARLTITICEEKVEEEEENIINEECCACEEAKYEVMFQGLWSKETHPRDFPSSAWLLHFSDVIGASHDISYRVWEAGGYASKGLTQVAKWGSPRTLESELKAESKHIRTIIKARGLWHPNVNGKTFAIFRTDSKNHLVSLVSMLGPSPDWIVGVSALEMCQANCTWLDRKDIYLYPWDAGVDSGISYESPDKPTDPSEPIKRITSQDPPDENNPFFKSEGGPLKPLAKLSIQKLREYKKSCSDNLEDTAHSFLPETHDSVRAGCEMTAWSPWSGCSVTCGKGISMRERHYIDPFTADNNGCDHQMVEKEMCSADVGVCQGGAEDAPSDWVPDDTCATTEWTDWSACSVACGTGFRARTRRFFNRMGRKKCPHVETVMKQTCNGERAVCAAEEVEVIRPECGVTDWSSWSPCSQSCGSGLKVRTRLYRVSKEQQMEEGCNVQLMQKGNCKGEDKMCQVEYNNKCSKEKEIGPCRGAYRRWYFDSKTGTCQEFYFGGCKGNDNNFVKKEYCVRDCIKQAPRRGKKEDMYLNDDFKNALDVLVKKRIDDRSEGMNEGFIEIEEQKQVLQKLENEQQATEAAGKPFLKMGELMAAQKKLMMMEKRMMMDKQMMMFKQKQMMMAKQRRMQEEKQKMMMLGQLNARQEIPTNTSIVGPNSRVDMDCVVTAWSPWSVQCSTTCGRGYRHRFRTISQNAAGEGRSCPRRLERQKKCRLPSCPAGCSLSLWGDWGPCSRTCGKQGTQTRHRYSHGTVECGHTVEEKVCLLPDCF